jgi:hypothetical protein
MIIRSRRPTLHSITLRVSRCLFLRIISTMGVYEARGSLDKGLKELLSAWAHTRSAWDDPMSRAFEEKFLRHLQLDLRNAVGAMDQMAVLLQQAYHDCE